MTALTPLKIEDVISWLWLWLWLERGAAGLDESRVAPLSEQGALSMMKLMFRG